MTSFVFPGQGSQFLGMAKDFYDNFKISRDTFEEIQDYVSIDLKKIIFENDENLLNVTKFTQISIFTASLTIFKAYETEKGVDLSNTKVMLGHSLGEYSALVCSKKIDLKDCSLILKKRGELMNDAVEPNKSGMAALIGLDVVKIENIIFENNLKIEVANDNSPMQVVISGQIDEINKAKDIFLKANIKKFVQLNVSAAFHSNFMIEAQSRLNKDIENLKFNFNDVKVISNYNAQPSNNNNILKDCLKKQMANRVRWTESIENLLKTGENKIIEIGPGKVLSGLIKRISNSFDISSISTISDIK